MFYACYYCVDVPELFTVVPEPVIELLSEPYSNIFFLQQINDKLTVFRCGVSSI